MLKSKRTDNDLSWSQNISFSDVRIKSQITPSDISKVDFATAT